MRESGKVRSIGEISIETSRNEAGNLRDEAKLVRNEPGNSRHEVAMTQDTPEVSPRVRARQKVIAAIADTMDLYGATYSFGQLYGIMYFEDRPMTLEEMKTHMNMSKSNMSYAVRSLMESRMVTKLEEKQERKDLYQAETDFFQAFRNFFTAKLQREIDVMYGAIEEVIPELTETILTLDTPDEERKLALQDLHKLRDGLRYYEWLQQFVKRLEAGEFFDEERQGTTSNET